MLALDLHSQPGNDRISAMGYPLVSGSTKRIARCPSLRTLYLLNGSLTASEIEEVAETHSLTKLRLIDCFVEPFEDELLHRVVPVVTDIKVERDMDKSLIMDWHLYLS
jgi:hypothetical protein